jgi:hypothetical protein
MSNLSVEFDQSRPENTVYSVPSSTANFIVSTRYQEFLSDQTTAYNPGDIVRYTINSADSLLDGRNSYFRFQLNPTFGAAVNSPRIDIGGIHAMINTFRVLLSNGTEIERIDQYNKLYAIARRYMLDNDYVKNLEASLSQDSLTDLWYKEESFEYPGVAAASTYTVATGTVAALTNGVDVREYISVGDYVEIVGSIAGLGASGIVSRVVDDRSFIIDAAGSGGAIANANEMGRIIVWKKYKGERAIITGQQGTSQYGVDNAASGFALANGNIQVMFKPFSEFFNNSKMIPLMLMRNLQFELTLEQPNLCFFQESSKLVGYTPANFTYTVSNCRFLACLRQPSEMLKNALLDQYNSPMGLPISYTSFWHSQNSINNNDNYQVIIPTRVKSCRGIISAHYYPYSETAVQLAQQYRSISTTPKDGITGYQYIIGSQRFPSYAEVKTDGILNGEMMQHALSIQGALGIANHPSSVSRPEFNANNTFPTNSYAAAGAVRTQNESKAFIMAINTSSFDTYSCGADLTSNQLQLQVTRAGGFGQVVVRSWVLHDRMCLLSASNTVVLY